jgi:hypothetical protein
LWDIPIHRAARSTPGEHTRITRGFYSFDEQFKDKLNEQIVILCRGRSGCGIANEFFKAKQANTKLHSRDVLNSVANHKSVTLRRKSAMTLYKRRQRSKLSHHRCIVGHTNKQWRAASPLSAAVTP